SFSYRPTNPKATALTTAAAQTALAASCNTRSKISRPRGRRGGYSLRTAKVMSNACAPAAAATAPQRIAQMPTSGRFQNIDSFAAPDHAHSAATTSAIEIAVNSTEKIFPNILTSMSHDLFLAVPPQLLQHWPLADKLLNVNQQLDAPAKPVFPISPCQLLRRQREKRLRPGGIVRRHQLGQLDLGPDIRHHVRPRPDARQIIQLDA